MATSGRGTGMVGYNVQMAADTKHHLIVAHDVINVGHDRSELWPMAKQAREAVGKEKLEVIADRGYFSGAEILACEQAGIKTLVPKPMTSNSKAEGRFSKLDFIYIARDDEYQCPAGEVTDVTSHAVTQIWTARTTVSLTPRKQRRHGIQQALWRSMGGTDRALGAETTSSRTHPVAPWPRPLLRQRSPARPPVHHCPRRA